MPPEPPSANGSACCGAAVDVAAVVVVVAGVEDGGVVEAAAARRTCMRSVRLLCRASARGEAAGRTDAVDRVGPGPVRRLVAGALEEASDLGHEAQ
jgi:hypothetical protein